MLKLNKRLFAMLMACILLFAQSLSFAQEMSQVSTNLPLQATAEFEDPQQPATPLPPTEQPTITQQPTFLPDQAAPSLQEADLMPSVDAAQDIVYDAIADLAAATALEITTIEDCCIIADTDPNRLSSILVAGQSITVEPVWVSDSLDIDKETLVKYPVTLIVDDDAFGLLTVDNNARTITAAGRPLSPVTVHVTAQCEQIPSIKLRYEITINPTFPQNAKDYVFLTTGGSFYFNLADLRKSTSPYFDPVANSYEDTMIACVLDGVEYPLPEGTKITSATWINDMSTVEDEGDPMPAWIEILPIPDSAKLIVRINLSNQGRLYAGQFVSKVHIVTDSADPHLRAFNTSTNINVKIVEMEDFHFSKSSFTANLLGNLTIPFELGELPDEINQFMITRENDTVKSTLEQTFEIKLNSSATVDAQRNATLVVRSGQTPKVGTTRLRVQVLWKNGTTTITNLTVLYYQPMPKVKLNRSTLTMRNAVDDTVEGLTATLPKGLYTFLANKAVVLELTNDDIADITVASSDLNIYPYQNCFQASHKGSGVFSLTLKKLIDKDHRGKLPTSLKLLLAVTFKDFSKPVLLPITVKLPANALKLSRSSLTLYQQLGVSADMQTVTLIPTPESAHYELLEVNYKNPEDQGAIEIVQSPDMHTLEIRSTNKATAKSYRLHLTFKDIPKTLALTVSVSAKANLAKLGVSKLTLQKNAPGEQVSCKLTLTATNHSTPDPYQLIVHEYETSKLISTEAFSALDLAWNGTTLTVKPNDQTEIGRSYVLDIAFSPAQNVSKHVKLTVVVGKKEALKLTAKVNGRLDVSSQELGISVMLKLSGMANKLWYRDLTADDFAINQTNLLTITSFDANTGSLMLNLHLWNSLSMQKNGMKPIKFTLSFTTGEQTLTTPILTASLTKRNPKTIIAAAQLHSQSPKMGDYGQVQLLDARGISLPIESLRPINSKSAPYTFLNLGNGLFRIAYAGAAITKENDSIQVEATFKGAAQTFVFKLEITNI